MKHHRRIPVSVSCLAALFVAACAGALAANQQVSRADAAAIVRSFKPLVSLLGHDSAIKDRRLVRITDKQSWEKLWTEHRGDDIEKAAGGSWPLFPLIDWDNCFVIAQFAGKTWNCNGEFVEAIDEHEDHITLFFDSATFQTAGPDGGGIRVTPFGIWVLPRIQGKPWVIQENVQGLIGEPPIWKEQARFDALQ